MKYRYRLAELESNAENRPPGYLPEVLSSGEVDGEFLVIDHEKAVLLSAKYAPPSLIHKAGTVVASAARWVSCGMKTVPESEWLERSSHCGLCEFWNARSGRCEKCGCYAVKLYMDTEHCPIGRW